MKKREKQERLEKVLKHEYDVKNNKILEERSRKFEHVYLIKFYKNKQIFYKIGYTAQLHPSRRLIQILGSFLTGSQDRIVPMAKIVDFITVNKNAIVLESKMLKEAKTLFVFNGMREKFGTYIDGITEMFTAENEAKVLTFFDEYKKLYDNGKMNIPSSLPIYRRMEK